PASAEGVGKQSGRDLEDETGELEDAAHQEQPQRVEVSHLDLVDEVRDREHAEEQGPARAQNEIDESRVFGTNGQLDGLLPPARGRGESIRRSGGNSSGWPERPRG